MNDIKQWYSSKTIWGALIAITASVLKMRGFELGAADQSAIADGLVSIVGAAGGLLAVYGRVTASATISAHYQSAF